ncbi:MAG: glycosyltransferase, partial [Phycicoccus sp.]
MNRAAGAVAAVVPCKDEADRIAATVAALRSLPRVGRVVVVDDGSADDTSAVAEAAGADVVRHERNRGKAAALETGVRRVRQLEADDARTGSESAASAALLFADGDLQGTATNLDVLLDGVLDGVVDMTVATLPAQLTAGGGRGFVVRLAREGVARLTGFVPVQPLSG